MNETTLEAHIEALIFASDRPLTTAELAELVNSDADLAPKKISVDKIQSAINAVVEKYNNGAYPFEVSRSGGGWQFLTRKEFHKTIAQLNGDKFLKRLSGAALETLSIIAYKQPVTKGEIESIRGVNCDYTVQKLLEKELILISGRNESAPGQPLLYITSKNFMDYFGINSSEELPKLKEIVTEPLSPTPVNGNLFDKNGIGAEGEEVQVSTETVLIANENSEG